MSLQQLISTFVGIVLFSAVFFLGFKAGDSNTPHASSISHTANISATTPLAGDDLSQQLKLILEQKLPGINISMIEKSPVAGIYQVMYSDRLIYVSENGQFILNGSLLELTEGEPIYHSDIAMKKFDNQKAPLRASTVAEISESDMVIFKASNEKYVISVFTDVDCPYCRKFHKDVAQLNKNGITVRYLAYPRAGIGSEAYKKLVSIWCADDRQQAMNSAKLEQMFIEKTCKNPIAQQFNLTQKLSLSGTPNIILEDGELIGGYMPAAQLLELLNKKYTSSASNAGVNSAK